MSFMVIAVAMLAAFCLQFLFQMVQMKSFNKFYTKLRKKGRVAAPSVCFGPWRGPRILLAAAPTTPPCFRRWRRSSSLLPKGEASGRGRVTCFFLLNFMTVIYKSNKIYYNREATISQ